MSSMGDRIYDERIAQGLSRKALAERVAKHGARIHETTVQKLEERASTKSRYSREIALALGVNHDWLLTGKGPKNPLLSLDAKLELLPADEMEEVYDDVSAIIERRLEKHRVRQ